MRRTTTQTQHKCNRLMMMTMMMIMSSSVSVSEELRALHCLRVVRTVTVRLKGKMFLQGFHPSRPEWAPLNHWFNYTWAKSACVCACVCAHAPAPAAAVPAPSAAAASPAARRPCSSAPSGHPAAAPSALTAGWSSSATGAPSPLETLGYLKGPRGGRRLPVSRETTWTLLVVHTGAYVVGLRVLEKNEGNTKM